MVRRITISSGVALLLVLALVGTTTAASVGKITFHNGYCTGQNTANGTFTVTKYSGVHGTRLTLTVKGQGYHNGAWRTEKTIGSWSKSFNTSAKKSLSKFVSFNPRHSGRHRLMGIGKIFNGVRLVASSKIRTGYCV
jgi:hypothetical protein